MAFYVWDTPEVAKFFNVGYSSKYHFYVSTDGTLNTVYKDDSRTFIGKSSIEQMKLLGIPEYKLHPTHGLIPANSKLFKEYTYKEQKEKLMKQPDHNHYEHMRKKVFEVGDKCVIKNIDMVSVMNECGQCICFREEMCYPFKTHKENTIDKMKEVCDYKGSWSSLYQQFASDLYDAGFRFEGDVE